MFTRLELANWRQFKSVEIVFHDRLTILTGPNGCGKTTILRLLANQFQWPLQMVSTPKTTADGTTIYASDVGDSAPPTTSIRNYNNPEMPTVETRTVGSIVQRFKGMAAGPHQTNISFEVDALGPTYELAAGRYISTGFYFPSPRPLTRYGRIVNVPVVPPSREKLQELYYAMYRHRYLGEDIEQTVRDRLFDTLGGDAFLKPELYLKRLLLSVAVFAKTGHEPSIELLSGFEKVLASLLPKELGFRKLEARPPELVMITDQNEFSFDAVSSGLGSVIDIGWQIYLWHEIGAEYTVLIDEPEAHLHPEMQQKIMPKLLEVFPGLQFIVATHSPLVATSMKESSVYSFEFDGKGKVYIKPWKSVGSKVPSADETLEKHFGLESTIPRWAADKLKEIVDKYSKLPASEELFSRLKQELTEAGLGDFALTSFGAVVKKEAPGGA